MTTSPLGAERDLDADPSDVPAGDLGAGGPADDPGDGDGPTTPPGYPDEVDPAEGPLAGRDVSPLGDLDRPGADA